MIAVGNLLKSSAALSFSNTEKSEIQTRRRILIVEDDCDVRSLLVHFLNNSNAEIIQAENGLAALRLVKNQEFDTILSDIEMPEMNGLKFLSCLRSLGVMTPVVILTAHGDLSRVHEALSLGAFDFISKDSKKKQILDSISTAINLGWAMRLSKNDPIKSSQLRKIFIELARNSRRKLQKAIEDHSG